MKKTRIWRHIAYMWFLLLFWVSFESGCGKSSDSNEVWSVHIVGVDSLVVESRNLLVDFSKSQAWTIRNIKYMGKEIVGEHGANGTVVSAEPKKELNTTDRWHGTGHGKEDVSSFTVVIDNIPQEFHAGMTFSGNEIKLRKESIMGSLGHTAEITFPKTGDYIIEKHSYLVLDDFKERFYFVYAFMHCNANVLNQWLALLEGGKELEGKAGKQDNSFSLQQDIKAIIFYGEEPGKGVVYEYPEVYKGAGTFKNSIWDREHDNKLYFRPDITVNDFNPGDRFEFVMKVTPFPAQPNDWKEKGRSLTGFEFILP
ncbi:MAG: hypothetical protein JXB48_20400 [Candidatus Latescibacteria bacterium]|nr:hypothetical protein [Candidatus Latescibacterota bacterium]